ncbi:MAG: radical SAM protein [Methanomicrobiales archaeon]|nr:radical SAM protein [Methanomicrobiales archaeon]
MSPVRKVGRKVQVTEKTCRQALIPSGIPGMEHCLNPYTGCTHACAYCYARFMMRFARTHEPWGSFVHPKVNCPERLVTQLRRMKPRKVMISSVTDPYQPAEADYGLTRSCLLLLVETGCTISILTKSALVIRDSDILKKCPCCEVGFSITTLDDRIAAIIEPGASLPSERIAVLRELGEAGIRTWVFIAPVLPGITDSEEMFVTIVRAARAAGAQRIACDPLSFYPAVVSGMREVLTRDLPEFREAFEAAVRDPGGYCSRLRFLARKYGVEMV